MRMVLVLILVPVAALAGCSSQKPAVGTSGPDETEILREVGGLISIYSGANRRGPAKLTDLTQYEQGYPLGYQAVRSGDVVVLWGGTVAGEGGGGSEDVVAYEKKVPADGGHVLLQNGKVKEMTAAEFAAAPKAGK